LTSVPTLYRSRAIRTIAFLAAIVVVQGPDVGIAGILSPLAFGKIIDLTGDWRLPFALSIGLLLLGAVMTYWMTPDQAFVDATPLARLPA
jgi:cyanate permease